MGFIRTLASALCLAWLFTVSLSNSQELVPGQVYNTGNIVNYGTSPTATTSTWQNVGLVNQGLPCWAPGGPVYCGPQPYYNQGTFNFSYGTTDVYQIANIASALPNSGTGLRVNGFNFNFTAKNGNGWDDGRQDYLVAYVTLFDSTGKVARNFDYSQQTNRKYDWTPFSFNETFDNPYASSDLSNVRYGFIGRDNNFWAGPYGPEITNISFRLKYSVDPCFVNVLSSPSCPGYLEAINKSSTSTVNETPTNTNTSSIATAPSVSTTVSTPTDFISTAATPTATSTVTQPSSTTSTTSASVTPTATNPQPRVGEVVVSGSPARTPISTSQILSIVRNEQSRISNLESNTAQQAIAQAQQQAETSQQESLSISANVVSNSTISSQAVISQNRTNNIYSLATGPVSISQSPTYSANTSSSVTQFRLNEPTKTVVEENFKSEGIRFTGTDLLNNFINPTTNAVSENRETKLSSVNQQVKDNDAAGNVSIASIAVVPVGFDRYSNVLKDAAFYEPKEIYRNQNVVDNARAQRLLQGGSDRLHQEMVEQQYRR